MMDGEGKFVMKVGWNGKIDMQINGWINEYMNETSDQFFNKKMPELINLKMNVGMDELIF